MSETDDAAIRKRILILEDNFLLSLELESRVEELGFRVIGSCSHLDDARRIASESEFELAILDINVRGGSSLPFAVELVERGVRCMFISGYSSVPDLPPQLESVPKLSKPLQPHELRWTLARLSSMP